MKPEIRRTIQRISLLRFFAALAVGVWLALVNLWVKLWYFQVSSYVPVPLALALPIAVLVSATAYLIAPVWRRSYGPQQSGQRESWILAIILSGLAWLVFEKIAAEFLVGQWPRSVLIGRVLLGLTVLDALSAGKTGFSRLERLFRESGRAAWELREAAETARLYRAQAQNLRGQIRAEQEAEAKLDYRDRVQDPKWQLRAIKRLERQADKLEKKAKRWAGTGEA
jgi:hypothetical protein